MEMITTMSYHYISTRTLKIKMPDPTKAGMRVEQLELSYTADGECKTVQPLWQRIWQIPKKLSIHLTYGIAIQP